MAGPLPFSNKVLNVRVQRAQSATGQQRVQIIWDYYVPGVPDVTSFKIYRAQSSTITNFVLLTKDIHVDFYVDTKAPQGYSNDLYYIVTYVSTSRGESTLANAEVTNLNTPPPPGFEGQLNYILKESVRRINWLLEGMGEAVAIFLRRRVGVNCPDCYDAISDKVTQDNCPTCFGTGKVGGFEKFNGRVFILSTERKLQESDFGYSVDHSPRGVIGSLPMLRENDVLIRQDNRRFLITGVTPHIIQAFLVEQEFGLQEMPKGSIAYHLQ